MSNKLKTIIRLYYKPFLIIFGVYCLAMLALWRANISYVDDIGRAMTGYGWRSDFNRYSSSIISFFLIDMNPKLMDLSPWTQILAMAILAITNIIILYLLGGKKIKPLSLVASLLLGLTPFAISCWLYKFDAPCMAIAMLVSVLPFLWWPEEKATRRQWLKFAAISFVGLFAMWTSYQSFSGVYIVMCLALTLKRLASGKKFAHVLKQALFCVVPYLLAALVYKYCMPEIIGYRPVEMLGLSDFIPGLVGNVAAMFGTIWGYLAMTWKMAIVVCLVMLAISIFVKFWKKPGLIVGSFVLLGLCVILSLGSYLVLDEVPDTARSLSGITIAFSVLAIFLAENITVIKSPIKRAVMFAPTVILIYMFIVFSFAISNALADQQRYSNFRNAEMVSDLSHLFPDRELVRAQRVQIQGHIGYSTVAKHVSEQYPIVSDVIGQWQEGLAEHVWGTKNFEFYYGYDAMNYNIDYERLDCSAFEQRLDTYYHQIRASEDDLTVCVILK